MKTGCVQSGDTDISSNYEIIDFLEKKMMSHSGAYIHTLGDIEDWVTAPELYSALQLS